MEKQTKQKTNEKIKVEKIKVTDIDIIVIDSKHFYYGIKYKKYGESEYNIGCGSYDIQNVIDWKEEYFELVTEERRNKSNK